MSCRQCCCMGSGARMALLKASGRMLTRARVSEVHMLQK